MFYIDWVQSAVENKNETMPIVFKNFYGQIYCNIEFRTLLQTT